MTGSRAGRHPEELVRHVCAAPALLTVAAHPSYSLPPPTTPPSPFPSPRCSWQEPDRRSSQVERRKRGETARWRARSRTGRAARIQPPFAAGEDGEASPRLCTRAKDGQEGFVGIGGTDGPGGQRERLLVGKGKGERVESSQAGRRKQPGIELIVFGCSRVWLLFRCDGIRCFLGRVGRFVSGVGGGGAGEESGCPRCTPSSFPEQTTLRQANPR